MAAKIATSRDFVRSSDKPKPLYLYYHSAYDHETWWDVDLSQRAPNHKVTQRSDHMVLQSHVTNENHYLCYQSAYGHQNCWKGGIL